MAKSGSPRGTSTSRSRRRTARQKAATGYDEQSHPRRPLEGSVDTEVLRERILPVVEQFGLVLEQITARGAGTTQTLGVVVDLPEDQEGSLSLDTVAELSEALSAVLDESGADPESAYVLEVGSPGAARKLTEVRHWKRSRGRLVEIKLQDGSRFLARLEEVDAAGATVQIRRKKDTAKGVPEKYLPSEHLPLDQVQQARVEVEFTD